MEETVMLSTIDNPYNPYENFSQWLLYDTLHGYHSCGKLDRALVVDDSMSDEEVNAAINDAIDDIIAADPTGMYIKVSK